MVLHILRALFVLLMAAAGYFFLDLSWITMAAALCLGVLFLCIDILSPRRKLAIFAGTFFGLVCGLVLAYALSFAVQLIVQQAQAYMPPGFTGTDKLIRFTNLLVSIVCCYLSVSFILQTKDDFRFIVPYIEFSKQTKGARSILLDSSVLIDGRINDIAATGILESQLVVPQFILEELQTIADSSDTFKRNRGRRGLDVLTKLRSSARVEVALYESAPHAEQDVTVDGRLMDLAKNLNARLMTNDHNLSKVAALRSVDVININDLGNALRPVVLPGEKMMVHISKAGEEAGQGVGYLSDGTMVVVEQARQSVNEDVEFTVTRALQTSAGRMIFGRLTDAPAAPPRRPRATTDPAPTSRS